MLTIEIITPDSAVFEGEADSVTLPTMAGEITVLPKHIPLMSVVMPGTVTIRSGKQEQIFAVSRGVIEVDGQRVRILADTADRAEGLEEATIEKAKANAEKLMTEKRHDAEGLAEAQAILERELARLKTVRIHRSRRGSRPTQQS